MPLRPTRLRQAARNWALEDASGSNPLGFALWRSKLAARAHFGRVGALESAAQARFGIVGPLELAFVCILLLVDGVNRIN